MLSARLGSLPNYRGATPLTGLIIEKGSKWYLSNKHLRCWLKIFCIYRGGDSARRGLGRYVFGSIRKRYLVAPRIKRRVRKLRACAVRRRLWVTDMSGSRFYSYDNCVVAVKTPYVVKQLYFNGHASRLVGRIKILTCCTYII